MPEAATADVVLYHAPRTRAFIALWLLEELGVDYRLESFGLVTGRHKQPDFLALNPMGKVPVVVDQSIPVAELGAIAIYLCDRYPAAGLGPAPDHPNRAAWLRWVLFGTAVMEPAYAQHFLQWQVPAYKVGWGSFEQMLAVVTDAVAKESWLVGNAFSAADVAVAEMLHTGIRLEAVPADGAAAAYVTRATDRPAYRRAEAIEQRESARWPPAEPA